MVFAGVCESSTELPVSRLGLLVGDGEGFGSLGRGS